MKDNLARLQMDKQQSLGFSSGPGSGKEDLESQDGLMNMRSGCLTGETGGNK